MSRENLQNLVERLSEDLGLADLRLDSELNACGFRVNDKLDVLIEYNEASDSAIFTITIGVLPEENRLAFALDLLDANYYGIGSGGGRLSTNSEQGTVYLQLREATERLDQERFHSVLQVLVNNAEVWRDRLDKSTTHSDAGAAPDIMDIPRVPLHGLV
ncbi:MAG: type III secretion system chaperone [Candidatus Methylacidiphilales bacterium]